MRFFTRHERVFPLAATAVVVAVCLSYGADRPLELVGNWILVKGYNKSEHWTDGVDASVPQKGMALYADGVGGWDGEGRDLRWRVENNRIILQRGFLEMAADYKLSGYELTLTYEINESWLSNNVVKKSAVFVKKDNLSNYRKQKDTEEELKNKKEPIYVTDSRDGQTYRTVQIGGKTWMAQNLNYWPKPGRSNCYDKNISNCAKYGRLYDWKTAQTACPTGWNLPTNRDIGNLIRAVGGQDEAGRRLKAKNGWNDNNGKSGNGADVYGFLALPGGFGSGSSFSNIGNSGYWWVDQEGDGYAFGFFVITHDGHDYVNTDAYIEGDWGVGYSIRCVQK